LAATKLHHKGTKDTKKNLCELCAFVVEKISQARYFLSVIPQPGQGGTKQEQAFYIRILRIVRIKI
jgi:hypothetical protein